MNFTDASKNSVQSLLALLRSTQDDERASGGGGVDDGRAAAPGAAGTAPSSGTGIAGAQRTPPSGGVASPSRANVPVQTGRNAQLSALLAQLHDDAPGTSSAAAATAASSTARGSAFDGPSHGLIDPFGPVGQTPRSVPRRASGDSPGGGGATAGAEAVARATTSSPADAVATPPRDKGKRKADAVEDRAEWSFTRCLPALTELLRDDAFVKELRKMKADQDALERRLWARMEKLKADCAAKTAPEREVAKITRKPVPADKQAKWDKERKPALDDFFRRQVLPATDGLAARQRARLVELGVPGLGHDGARGEDAAAQKVRVQRIMGVLEGALDS